MQEGKHGCEEQKYVAGCAANCTECCLDKRNESHKEHTNAAVKRKVVKKKLKGEEKDS